MNKIIIVEDEEIIRNGLAISFDWMDAEDDRNRNDTKCQKARQGFF